MDTTKKQKLCECGCGQPAPIATRNWHTKGIRKGQPLRFICGHHRRGKEQSKEEKIKRVKKWGVEGEVSISPYLPGNRVIRYYPPQKRWYCSQYGTSSKKPHARAVYEHFYGPVLKGWAVHHKSGSAERIEDDRPENLIAIPKIWNWNYMPFLALGFGVPESTATEAYIKATEEGLKEEHALFRRVCKLLLGDNECR